jgi:hypothetical protein
MNLLINNIKYLRKSTKNDIDKLWSILQKVMLDLEKKKQYHWSGINEYTKKDVEQSIKYGYCIMFKNKIVGSIVLTKESPEYYDETINTKNSIIVRMFYIEPDYRNTITLKVILEIKNKLNDLVFDCSSSYELLNKFYIRLGGVKIGEASKKNYKGNVYKIKKK